MSELEVPDFKSIEEFENWAKKLEDKQIQSWSTKDWLKVYEKIDAYVDSPEFDKVYRENLPKLIKDNIFYGSVEDLADPSKVDVPKFKKIAFVELNGGDVLSRLNRNFRLEPKQLETIRELGRDAGKQLAEKGVNLADLSIYTTQDNSNRVIDLMTEANDITIGQTKYKKFGMNYKQFFSVGIDNEMKSFGVATYEPYGNRKLKINNRYIHDGKVQTVFHETAHLHLQNSSAMQQGYTRQNFLANPELNRDFYILMQKNSEYYISPQKAQRLLTPEVLGMFDLKKQEEIKKKAYNGYHRQPIEKYSEIYGIEAERALRQESKQLTERTAMKVADTISDNRNRQPLSKGLVSEIGRPEEVRYTSKGVELTYKPHNTGVGTLEKSIKSKFAGMDEELLNQMDIQKSRLFGEVRVTIPNNNDFALKYSYYLTATQIADRVAGAEGMPRLPNGLLADIGMPKEIKNTGSGIELTYKPHNTDLGILEKSIKNKFAGMDEELFNKMNIRTDGYSGEIKLTVPKDYDFSRKYNKYIMTPQTPPTVAPPSLSGNTHSATYEQPYAMEKVAQKELQVPDFKTAQEFESWVYKLEDKEIQSWTTKDWLKMYEKLDKVEFRTEAELGLRKDALIKLNRNYRLEEADFKKMQEIGKKIGHNLAQQKMDFDLAAINIDNNFMEGAREQYARAADKAIYESSQYAGAKDTPLGDYDTAASKINISEAEKADYIGVAREADKYSSEISLSNSVEKDVFGSTPLHEGVHAQLQTLRTGQQEALAKLGLKPEEGFSEDFYKLLQYNDKYYVESAKDSRIYGDLELKLQEGEITQQEFEKLTKSEVLKGSTKQPLETHAQIIGVTAEHYYRQETGQLSERKARALTEVMGKPQTAQYNQKGEINLSYHVENKEAFDKKLSALPKDKINGITAVYDEKRRMYTLTVPSKTSEQVTTEMAHKFPSVADIKGVEKVDVYHGSRNFFENYDYTRARTVGGAQYGLGQYFTTKENMAYSYATLDKEAPFIEKNVETNGEKVATQKVVYQGEISGADLNKILVPEKMTDADYDALIKTARSQGKEALAEELTKIKSVAKDRHIDLYQWLRKTESVDLMQSAGINGVYSTERDIYAVYNTSNMNIKVKEAVVLDGTDIPKSLIADKSVIHIQESLAGKPSETHISTSEGSALQKAGTPEGKTVTAVVEKTSSKTASQSTEKAATKTATKTALRAQATNAARKFGATVNKTAKSAGQAVTKAAQGTKEALLAANKAYDDTFDAIIKWGDKHAPQWMNKVEEATVQKAAEKFMKTKSGQAIAKQIEKKIGKEAAASIAKKIPILCLGVGAACVYDRLKDGEYLKAVGEGASAIVANVPGLGTLASFGLDGAMLSDDLKVFEHGVIPKDQNSHVAAESTGYDNQLKRMNELIDKQNKEAKSQKEVREAAKKKAAEEAPKMMENIQKLAPWNDTSRT